MSATKYLDLADGRMAYDDAGDGPLLVATPAMLDLRSELRFLVPLLVEAGLRVVTIDQRGMGESSGRWPAYGSTPMAGDLMALIRHLDAGPAIVYGTSNGAAAGVYAAAEAPELIRGLVLAAPFVRDGSASWVQRQLMNIMRVPFLTHPLYMSYYPKWEPLPPPDAAAHKARLAANLKEPERRDVIKAYLLQQTHAEAEARLDRVTAPALVFMGTGDVDWPDPVAEGRWVADQLNADLVLLEGGGHHPHVDHPREVAEAVIAFTHKLTDVDREVEPGDEGGRSDGSDGSDVGDGDGR